MTQPKSRKYEDLKRALTGFGSQVRGKLPALRNIADIAEIEAMLDRRGAAWTKAFEDKCDAASLALFGIIAKDVDPPEPHPDGFSGSGRTSLSFSDEALATYNVALGAWHEFRQAIALHEADVSRRGAVAYWRAAGYDITDSEGVELRCFRYLGRQMLVALKELLPGAALTLDGSGKRAPLSVDDWERALAADAAKFKRSC